MIKTKLTLTTAMSIEEDLKKEDKELSTLLSGAHSTELPPLTPVENRPSPIETQEAEPKVSAE